MICNSNVSNKQYRSGSEIEAKAVFKSAEKKIGSTTQKMSANLVVAVAVPV
jgi:hypothetical protein